MPLMPDGSHADVVLNPLGVLNRMNPAQLTEQYINFMSDHVVDLMKKEEDYLSKQDIYMSYLKEVDKEQYDFIDSQMMRWTRAQREDYIDDIEEHGIFIHQSPFFGNTAMDDFKRIRINHPEWCTRYKCEGIENPLVIGDVYFIRLSFSRLALIAGSSLEFYLLSIFRNEYMATSNGVGIVIMVKIG